MAHRELPGKIPGALAAVLLGVVDLLACRLDGIGSGLAAGAAAGDKREAAMGWQPVALLSFWDRVRLVGAVIVEALNKLPVVLPFALATIVGGIDCTESAAAAGDEYDTRAILLTEGVASLRGRRARRRHPDDAVHRPSGLQEDGRAGGVYPGDGAVRRRRGYFGVFQLLFEWLPKAAMFPILVFVGLEITAQSFHATPAKHYPALAFAMLPALAYLVMVPMNR